VETQEVAQHVHYMDQPHYAPDDRLMYYEEQTQRWPHYSGIYDELPVEDARIALRELCRYFGLPSGVPLPPAGLPGCLHEKYDQDEPAFQLMRIGLGYASAVIFNERRGMHNRWKDARTFIRTLEQEAEERVVKRVMDREAQLAQEREAREAAMPQLVYFIASEAGPIKIGIANNPVGRLKTLQTSHHEKLHLLVTCAGGQPKEAAYHKLFAPHRLAGEWFARAPEIEAEIARLQTEDTQG